MYEIFSGALAPIVNSAYQGNYSPMKRFGFGGFGGHENYAGNVSIFFFVAKLFYNYKCLVCTSVMWIYLQLSYAAELYNCVDVFFNSLDLFFLHSWACGRNLLTPTKFVKLLVSFLFTLKKYTPIEKTLCMPSS